MLLVFAWLLTFEYLAWSLLLFVIVFVDLLTRCVLCCELLVWCLIIICVYVVVRFVVLYCFVYFGYFVGDLDLCGWVC